MHVFSVDGEVYSAPWDDIFFTTGDCVTYKLTKRKNYDIRGHVLAEDRKTVLKTFTLSVSAPRREDLYRNWEFVRRYMEEGPEAVAGVLNRVFAMYTCRIPRWSEEVEASCVIAPDDPWDISAAQNPRSLWRWMLGMDKSHSMVDKKRAMMAVIKVSDASE
nr:DUF6708 domain-containing protein [Klebsiella michiganensis]